MKMLMSQGRGNAIDVSVLLMGMLLRCGNVWAATYTVGDAAGWSFNVVVGLMERPLGLVMYSVNMNRYYFFIIIFF